MYSALTFDAILKRMLDRVSARYDKREGSIKWDSLAPAAAEFYNAYVLLEAALMEMFADTATRNFLIKHCLERGITPKPAGYAIVKGEFTPSDIEIPIGSRFSHEDLNYAVTEKISDGLYYLKCETIGSVANGVTGQLIPINYINGLQTAHIVEVSIVGEDEEDTESLRRRYFESLKSEAFGGNRIDYQQKILSIAGVGQVKIYSASQWNGGGTVKCVILDSDDNIPTEELVEEVQTIIDPEANSGEGSGLAPIGHFVTIVAAYNTPVDVSFNLTYAKGYSWEVVKSDVQQVIDEYLEELNKGWSETDKIRVRIAHIESRILDVTGVLDIQDTTINGKAENLSVDKDSIVTRGTVNG